MVYGDKHMSNEKHYDPHIVVVWTSETTVAVQEFPYEEDAVEKYNEVVQLHFRKVALARIVREHGEG